MHMMRNASPAKPFTCICNTLLQDCDLSLEATGALTRVLSLPINWEFNKSWALSKWKMGVVKLDRILKELVDAGYCRIEQSREDDGKFCRNVYSFTDVAHHFCDDGYPDSRSTEIGVRGTRDYKRNIERKETEIKNPLTPFSASAASETKTPPIPQGGGGHSCVMTRQENHDSLLLDAFIQEDGSKTPQEAPGATEQLPLGLDVPEEKKPTRAKRKASGKLNHNNDPEFEKFWSKYPKKMGKAGAYTHWKRFCKENPELAALLPEAAQEYERDIQKQHKSSAEAKQKTCNGYNWFNKGLHESYAEMVRDAKKPIPVVHCESQAEQRAREARERAERVAAACSGAERSRFVSFLAKVYDNVKDAWNEKVKEYFHARTYWDIDALLPLDVKNEARTMINAPLLAS